MAKNTIQQQIFIGGCSRSGTTLLGAMLGAHSRCICSPESHFKIDVLRTLNGANGPIDITETLNYIVKHWRFKIWDLPLDNSQLTAEMDGASFADLFNWLISQYAAFVGQPHVDSWVDHTPENVGYALPLLAQFPHAKFIHIIRDGRGVAASIMPLDWGPNSVIKAARWWMRLVSFGLAAETFLDPEQIMRVRYEDLVRQPEETLQTVCRFLGFDYEPEMEKADGFVAPRYTTRQHPLIGKAPDGRLTGRWEQRLTPREVEIFENLTRSFLPYLGYPLRYGLAAKSPSFWEIQQGKASELFRGELLNKFKWLFRSYPLWLSRDFYAHARLSDTNN